jgi:hypothetical protein
MIAEILAAAVCHVGGLSVLPPSRPQRYPAAPPRHMASIDRSLRGDAAGIRSLLRLVQLDTAAGAARRSRSCLEAAAAARRSGLVAALAVSSILSGCDEVHQRATAALTGLPRRVYGRHIGDGSPMRRSHTARGCDARERRSLTRYGKALLWARPPILSVGTL